MSEISLEEIESRQVELLTDWFAKIAVAEGEWRNLDRAVQAIRAYNAAYPAHEWTVLGVEEEFSVYVGDVTIIIDGVATVVPCYLDGRKDLIVGWHDGVWVVDHKTASEWGDNPDTNQELLGGRRSFQFRGYAWAEREAQRAKLRQSQDLSDRSDFPPRLVAPVRGVVGNYIIGRKPYSESAAAVTRRANSTSLKPRDAHHQEFYAFDDATLDEWRTEFLLVARRILTAWQSGEWEASFDRGCAHYGRCEFYDYCEESPATRETTLTSSLYRQRELPTVSQLETEP